MRLDGGRYRSRTGLLKSVNVKEWTRGTIHRAGLNLKKWTGVTKTSCIQKWDGKTETNLQRWDGKMKTIRFRTNLKEYTKCFPNRQNNSTDLSACDQRGDHVFQFFLLKTNSVSTSRTEEP